MKKATQNPWFFTRTKMLSFTAALSSAFILLILALSPTFRTQAAMFDLTGSCPGGVGDVSALASTLTSANGNGEADIITLAVGCVYTLTTAENATDGANGLPSITSPIVIQGNGAVIRRDPGAATAFRIFHVAGSGALTLDNLTVENGAVNDGMGGFCPEKCGGGIYAAGALTLSQITLRHNIAEWDGGGLYSVDNVAVITASTFFTNVALGSGGGASFAAETGTLHAIIENSSVISNAADLDGGGFYGAGNATLLTLALTNTTVSYNRTIINGFGGGIAMRGGGGLSTLDIADSAITWNTASRGGGGIQYSAYGLPVEARVAITRSAISFNQALDFDGGGGIMNMSDGDATMTLTLTDSTVQGNQATLGNGGGIFNTIGRMVLNGVTVSDNQSAGSGGGISNMGEIALTNCTVSDNQTTGDGGGLNNINTMHLTHVTVAGNTADSEGDDTGDGGGLLQGATATLTHTILSDNVDSSPTPANVFTDCYQTIWGGEVTNSGGYNLVQDVLGCTGIFTATGDITGTNPLLGPLQDNGGPTWTRALLTGSPAQDQIPNLVCGTTTDQRGAPRPYPLGGACDIGAYEVHPPQLDLTKSVAPSAAVPHHGIVTYTLTLNNAGVGMDPAVILTDTLPAGIVFGQWVLQPAGVLRQGNTFTWTGALTGTTALTWIFTATHTGGYNEVITNTAFFSGMVQTGSAAAAFTVEPNYGPVLTGGTGDQTTDEGVTLTFTVTATDANVHDTLTYTLGAGSVGSITAGGVFTWTPTEAQGPGVYTATLIVSDGELTDTVTITITVAEVNDYAPVLDSVGDQTVAELTPLTFTATATDNDLPAPPLTFTLGAGSVGSITAGGVFTWTPTEVQGPGVYTAAVHVSDGELEDGETFTITVTEANTAPVLGPLVDYAVQLGATVRFTATATDADVPTNPLTFTLGAGAPAGATLDPTTGAFAWTPATVGVYPFTVRVTDGDLSDAADLTITVATQITYTLQIAVAGDGQGTITPGVGAHQYLSGTTVIVTATAQSGSVFVGWSGAATGTTNPTQILMDDNKVLTATFQDIQLATFTMTAQPTLMYANGLDEATLRITAATASGNGAPFAGRVVTVTWANGFYPGPDLVTLGADGTATTVYVAGLSAGTQAVTATIADDGVTREATDSILLLPNPLMGKLTFETYGWVITYTFVLSNVSNELQSGVVLTGSVPANTILIGVTDGFSVTTGGDYGEGYVSSLLTPPLDLAPGESHTLKWTVLVRYLTGDIITQAHATSETARLRLGLVRRVYRILLPQVFYKSTY